MKRRPGSTGQSFWQLLVATGFLAVVAIPLRGAQTTDAPKTEAPKIDVPKTDAPKIDAPKIDAPKIDAPKTDAPKTDAPKTSPQSAEPKRIKQDEKGIVVLQARDVVVHGKTVRYEPDKNTIGYWSKQADWVSWELEITHPDTFSVQLFAGCGSESGGSHIAVEIADQKLEDKVQETGSFHIFRRRKVGEVTIDKPGNYTLSVRAEDKPGVAVMDLRTVTLTPVKLEKEAKEAGKSLFKLPDGGKSVPPKSDGDKPGDAKPADVKPADKTPSKS